MRSACGSFSFSWFLFCLILDLDPVIGWFLGSDFHHFFLVFVSLICCSLLNSRSVTVWDLLLSSICLLGFLKISFCFQWDFSGKQKRLSCHGNRARCYLIVLLKMEFEFTRFSCWLLATEMVLNVLNGLPWTTFNQILVRDFDSCSTIHIISSLVSFLLGESNFDIWLNSLSSFLFGLEGEICIRFC